MDVRIKELAARQADLVAVWQLVALGLTRHAVVHAAGSQGWRRVHSGVYALTSSPLTRRQRWIAATLTTPDSVLSNASAGACWGIRRFEGRYEIVTRPGSGGQRQLRGLLVLRSATLAGDVVVRDGIRITTGARTLVDLAPSLNERDLRRTYREAMRLKATSTQPLLAALERHAAKRGTRLLKELATRYRAIPYKRCRSDAESLGLELMHDGRVAAPQVNVRVAGEEADLVWPARRLIIEIDGPQYHQFPEEDARKQALWERAGFEVRRIPSDAVYHDPARLLALARVP
jgi:very-short-patch-repair endonuclease